MQNYVCLYHAPSKLLYRSNHFRNKNETQHNSALVHGILFTILCLHHLDREYFAARAQILVSMHTALFYAACESRYIRVHVAAANQYSHEGTIYIETVFTELSCNLGWRQLFISFCNHCQKTVLNVRCGTFFP